MDVMGDGGAVVFRSRDTDEVSAYCENYFFKHRISHFGGPRDFGFSLRDTPMGPIRIAEMTYAQDAAVHLGGYQSSYAFILPANGVIRFDHRNSPVTADPANALIVGPREAFNLTHWAAGTKALLVSFGEDALGIEVAAMLGSAVRGPVSFRPQARIDSPSITSWIELVRTVHRSKDLMRHSRVLAALSDGIIRGFLASTRHEYRERIDRSANGTGSPTVSKAIEMIDQSAHLPLTPSLIAAYCNVEVRTLQYAFRKHLGTTPMAYLRQVRMQRIHTDLRDSHDSAVTVASIVHRWGVTHLGHFSAAYRSAFGVLPSETLRAERKL